MKRIVLDQSGPEVDIDRDLVRAEIASALFGHAPVRLHNGRFQLIRRRGRGSLGVVYEAIDVERDERVAVKVLTRKDSFSAELLQGEFARLAGIRHPNLVRLDGMFQERDALCFSMELVNGEPFDAHVRGLSGDRDALLRDLLRQLAGGLQAIHAAGKLHRNLKRRNVLVTPERRVVVLDFGLLLDAARGPDTLPTESEFVGNPAYLAPELLRGLPRSRASDWYAIGVLLYEALTGKRLFEGSLHQLLIAKQERDAPDPRSLASDVAPDLAELCLDLLRREPGQRASGDDVTRALGRR